MTRTDEIFLALDYGGTKLSAAIARRGEREWLAIDRHMSRREKDARYEQAEMLALAHKLLGDRKPAAIGVSFGGPVDAAHGRVILSHHVPGWEDTPLRAQLQSEFGAPASVDNDANVAALGEYTFGAGLVETFAKRVTSLLYVTVSTGVGGGWVIGGKIWNGADAMAGEIGHTIADRNGPLCVCGRHGCVEIMASGTAIANRAKELLKENPGKGKELRELCGNQIDQVTGAMVAQTANSGDELAQQVMDDAARALGFGIGTAITLMNPERVVLGGGITKSGERWWSVVRESARSNTLPQHRINIIPAAFSDDAPLWGAIALAESVIKNQ
ncbi:MAG: ROK family protein [Chloroflexi bacterium]|nr:ROK family protein [Chloroflexota bacterium]